MLELPTDRPRPPSQTFRGQHQSLVLSKTIFRKLQALSQREGVTLFMTLLAAFKVLLHRYTGQDDIVVGTPIAGRDRTEVEGLIGFFLNTLVLRSDFSGNPTFQELLGRVREAALGAYAHQDLPFEKLLEEMKLERDLSRTPLFQVFFNMHNFPDGQMALSGLTVEALSLSHAVSHFDVTLYVLDHAEGIRLTLVYNADLFAQARMLEMLDQFKHLLSQIVENPEERINRFSLVIPTAEALLPNPTEPLASDWEGAVHTQFSQRARRIPERLAVADKQQAWTYQELDAGSNQLAHCLQAGGIQRQDIVAVYGHRSAPLVLALLGVLKAGAAFVILDPSYPPLRLIDYLRVAMPRAWIQIEAAGALPDTLEEFIRTLSCRCRLVLDRELAAMNIRSLAGYPASDPEVAVDPDDLAYVAFTSGTAGMAKAIRGTHRPLSHFLRWHCETFELKETDRFSMFSGLSHDPLAGPSGSLDKSK